MDSQMRAEIKTSTKEFMGSLADRTKILSAKITGFEKDSLGIAVLKATLQDDNVPKEKHVRNLKIAVGQDQPQSQVLQVLSNLCERFDRKAGWVVMLKGLIVFHRLLAEGDQSFQETVFKFAKAKQINSVFQAYGLRDYADFSTRDTQQLSAFIRVYATYLDERLEAFRSMKFDPIYDTGDSKLKNCSATDLLDRLPRAQRLLGALLDCVPEGAALFNNICRYAARMVLSESKTVYRLVSEGIMNLADKYFEMSLEDALKGLELYKKSVNMNERLNGFFSSMNNIPGLKGAVSVPTLQALPADFLTTMEDYVREAPREGELKSRKGAGPLTAKTSTMAARGGVTSSALGGSGAAASTSAAPPPPEPEPTPPPAPAPAPAPPPPEVDLLNFGSDSPMKRGNTPKAAAAAGPLDMLADGAASSSNGFGDSAWGSNGHQAQQQQPQQPGYGMQPTGYEAQHTGMGYQPQPTGMDPYGQPGYGMPGMMPPMQNGYGGYGYNSMGGPMGMGYGGPAPGFGGGSAYAESQALVLYNPGAMMGMGMPGANPFLQGPPLPPTAPVNTNNPFTTSTVPGVSGTTAPSQSMFQGTRLANDPLNEFTEQLLGKADEPKTKGPALREMRKSSQAAEAFAPAQGAIALGHQ